MAGREYLGGFEQVVLLAVLRLRSDAYGMRVRQEIEERTGRRAAIGAVYATLDRLERKGLISSRDGQPTPERGNRAWRYFSVTAPGVRAMNESRQALGSLWRGLKPAGTVA